ncbi:MAG: hypothetical protein H6581_25480 [Bacteroidia bacterium]|nr:hypothetical protein [Bacteroidia bacterium]
MCPTPAISEGSCASRFARLAAAARFVLLVLTSFICLSNISSAQFTGGHEAGQAAPRRAEKATLNAGPMGGDVNLFTGALDLSYDFGAISTPTDLSFPISLSYNSTALTQYDAPQNSGIPYGEGWNLAQGAISVDLLAFDFVNGDLPKDPQLRTIYEPQQVRMKGQTYYLNVQLNLPGYAGRLVYKYPAPTDSTHLIYVLEGFSGYVEAEFDGANWTVKTDDGTLYYFDVVEKRNRNPTNFTAQLEDELEKQLLPKTEPVKWHLSRISNPNHARDMQIVFYYKKFGRQRTYQELNQPQIQNHFFGPNAPFMYHDVITPVNRDYFVALGICAPCNLGDSVYYKPITQQSLDAYDQVILTGAVAFDNMGVVYQQVDLKYKTWRPEIELAGDPVRFRRGKFLTLSDPRVIRVDSMYHQKTVWFRGQEVAENLAKRPAVGNRQFTTDWNRYQHPAAHQNPLSDHSVEISDQNPFAARYAGISGTNAPLPQLYYRAYTQAEATPGYKLHFTHSVLESPRMSATDLDTLPSGEMYELRTVLKVPSEANVNFDFALVTGLNPGNQVERSDASGTYKFCYDSGVNSGGSPTSNLFFDRRGHTIFSTLGNVIKWNPAFESMGVYYYSTANQFRMPNLPNEFEGFHIQVGPGSDNLLHHEARKTKEGFPEYYNNYSGANRLTDHQLAVTAWFGSGAPLEPILYHSHFFQGTQTNNYDKGKWGNSQYRLFWRYPLLNAFAGNSISLTQLLAMGANQPTALTHEWLISQPTQNSFYHHTDLALVHESTQQTGTQVRDAELTNLELVRITQNPWMLDSVVFSVPFYGKSSQMKRVSAYKLGYELDQVRILNNLNTLANLPQGTPPPSPWKMLNGEYQYRNLWHLARIERVGCDTMGKPVATGQHPATLFKYFSDNHATPGFNEAYLIRESWNELGGKKTWTYNLDSVYTRVISASGQDHFQDSSSVVMGGSQVISTKAVVKKVTVDDGSSQGQTLEYLYQNPVGLYKGLYEIDLHFKNGYNWSKTRDWVTGFEKVTVKKPSLGGSGNCRTGYTHRVSKATMEDTLLFGRLVQVEEFDEAGQWISRKEMHYTASMAYRSARLLLPSRLVRPMTIVTQVGNYILPYERDVMPHLSESRRMNSWFLRLETEVTLSRDPLNGNVMADTTRHTWYDWTTTQTDPDGDYAEMYADTSTTFTYNQQDYLKKTSQATIKSARLNYIAEPSWQKATQTQTFSEHPGAFRKTSYYYLYDIKPLLENHQSPTYYDTSNVAWTKWAGTIRPYYLAQKYGIRNVPVETRTSAWDGDTTVPVYSHSTWYWYESYDSVGGAFVREWDSTNYGKTCGPPSGGGGGGGPVVIYPHPIKFTQYIFSQGHKVPTFRVSQEALDDPRYVQDTSGEWYFFPVAAIDTVSAGQYASQPEFSDSLAGQSGFGYLQGPNSEVKYYGTFVLKDGFTFAATTLVPAGKNYGEQSPNGTAITPDSRKKVCLLLCAHPDTLHGPLCALGSQLVADSTLPPLPYILPDTADSLSGQREIFLTTMDQQFFLAEVYTQADSMPNIRMNPAHTRFHKSIHDIYEPQPDQNLIFGSSWKYRFAPVFAAIRQYKVHARNMYGQIVDESDVRSLHYIYEYKNYWLGSWNECGVPQSDIVREALGQPVSLTVTDKGAIEHTTIFRYHPDNLLKRVISPNLEAADMYYDPFKRLSSTWMNGALISENEYHHWAGNLSQSFAARTAENYVQSKTWDGVHAPLHSLAYLDPMGRAFQAIIATQGQGGWTKSFAGRQEFDAWNRPTRAFQPYAKSGQAGPGLDLNVPVTPFAEMQYEANARSRVLKGSRPGNPITGPHVSQKQYAITDLWTFYQESGIDIQDLYQIWPGKNYNLGPVSTTGGGKPKPNQAAMQGTLLLKTLSEDEDGKRSIAWADQLGRTVASLAYTDTTYGPTTRVLTIFIPHIAGGVQRIVHPNQLTTTQRFNYLGWPIEVNSPDKGLEKFLYLPDGSVRYYQDANLRKKGRVQVNEYDKMGRTYRQYTSRVASPLPGLYTVPFLLFQNSGGYTFQSIHTILEFPKIKAAERNCNDQLWNKDYTGKCFPCLQYSESQQIKEREYRYDYPQDSGAVSYYGVNMDNKMLPPSLFHLIKEQQHHPVTRLTMALGYGPVGELNDVSYFSYNAEGNTEWVVRQFDFDGIANLHPGDAHVIYTPDYDRQGRLLTRNLDLGGDSILDFQQHFTYDAFGRLHEVYASRRDLKAAGAKLAEYHYDDATGRVTQLNYFVAGTGNCQQNLPADSILYSYDQQDRLSRIQSTLFDFGLYYDQQNPNVPPGSGGNVGLALYTSSYGENYNGNINGTYAKYNVLAHGVTGFDRATVYGYQYDGLNRLTDADASVLEHITPASGSQYPSQSNFGQPLTTSQPAWYGDATYQYDKVGNLTALRRYHYYAPGSGLPLGDQGDNWTYTYQPGTNRLTKLSTLGRTPTGFTYDYNGNLYSDSKRQLSSITYSTSNRPWIYTAANRPVVYRYTAGQDRMYKLYVPKANDTVRVFYLLDGGGLPLAIHDDSQQKWTFEIYGADLIGEYEVADSALADSSNLRSGQPSAVSGQSVKRNRAKNVVKWLSKGIITAVPFLVETVTHQPEQGEVKVPFAVAAVPVAWALSDAVIDALWKDKVLPANPVPNVQKTLAQDTTADSLILGVKFFVKDHLGNVRVTYVPVIYDTLHTCSLAYEVKSVMDYYPYGKHLRAWFAGDAERWQTTMNERDGESGLDWRGARMYDAEYGRFLQIDPMAGKFPHLTPYNYTENRPVFWGDPSGNCPECVLKIYQLRANTSEGIHYALDVIGFIPGYGEVADGINAMMYAAEGRTGEALVSVASMVPIEGVLPTLGKWGAKALGIGEEAVEAGVKVADDVVEETTEVVVKKEAKGGDAYGRLKNDVGPDGKNITERNHIPSYNSYELAGFHLSRYRATAHSMLKPHHRDFITTGSGDLAKKFRSLEGQLLQKGKFLDAFELNAAALRKDFGDLYENEINQAREHFTKEIIPILESQMK